MEQAHQNSSVIDDFQPRWFMSTDCGWKAWYGSILPCAVFV